MNQATSNIISTQLHFRFIDITNIDNLPFIKRLFSGQIQRPILFVMPKHLKATVTFLPSIKAEVRNDVL